MSYNIYTHSNNRVGLLIESSFPYDLEDFTFEDFESIYLDIGLRHNLKNIKFKNIRKV